MASVKAQMSLVLCERLSFGEHASSGDSILLETGDYVLTETGDKVLKES